MKIQLLATCIMAIALSACASVKEQHYIGAFTKPSANNPTGLVNVFRVNIKGNSGFANVRYITGTYDERAIDFFLNESKAKDYSPSAGLKYGPQRIFEKLECGDKEGKPIDEAACKKVYKDAVSVSTLTTGPNGTNDSFVIILSTNANAIAETIGAITENEIAIKSVNYLLNKDTIEEAALITAKNADFAATRVTAAGTLGTLLTEDYAGSTSKDTSTELLILNLLANELSPGRGIYFSKIEEATAWFSTVQ